MISKVLIVGLLLFAGCLRFANSLSLGRSLSRNRKYVNAVSNDFETHYYTQILDHFTFMPQTYNRKFHQRYLLVRKFWDGPHTNSPIFVFAGDEGDIVSSTDFSDFLIEIAARFKALLVYVEHRYYGLSMPFGSKEESFKNATTLGYLTAEQALADYATFITDLKEKNSAQDCPVIVFGGSYGGMLAAWFRLKYPHIAAGALASSAPILYFEDITLQDAYPSIVTKDFISVSNTCYTAIKSSWEEIEKVASRPGGLAKLRKIFNTCQVFNNTATLTYSLTYAYEYAAQYDYQLVKGICEAIDGSPKGTDVLNRISAGATYFKYNTEGSTTCYDLEPDINEGWNWQECTEMVMPISFTPNTTMFPSQLFDVKSYAKDCWKEYGVLPRPNWITTEFGGHNIKRVLKRSGSNIIFSNGLRDPWSGGGLLESVSESIIALVAEEGVHCQDLASSRSDDPQSVKEMRLKEIGIIGKWLDEYKQDLTESKSKGI